MEGDLLKMRTDKCPELCIVKPPHWAKKLNKMSRKIKLIGSENITPTEIHLIMGADIDIAVREHEHIRNHLGHHSNDLLVSQYCQFNGLDNNEITQFLNQYREEEELSTKNSN